MDLAWDVHDRAATLIPYLPLARLKDARAEHTRVGEELARPGDGRGPIRPPFRAAEDLLAAAGDPATPVEQSPADRPSRLKALTEVDEGRLVPFARERVADLWEKLFKDDTTEEKVQATRLHTLGGLEGNK